MNLSLKASSSITLVIFCFLGIEVLLGYAEEPQKKEEEENLITVQTKEGLYFKVPPDRPIVNRDGVVSPIPMDEYLHQKIKTLTERLDEMDKKMEAMTERLDKLEKR